MLRDFSNKFAIGASLALAILLSAGLVQAVVTDDVNFSVVAPEGVSLGSNATSEVAGGVEDGDQANLTGPLSEVGGEAAANETAPPTAAGAAEVPATADTANETLPEAANGSGVEIKPEAAGGVLRAVCLNGCSYTTIQADPRPPGELEKLIVDEGDPLSEEGGRKAPRSDHLPRLQDRLADLRPAVKAGPLVEEAVAEGEPLGEGLRVVRIGGHHPIAVNRRGHANGGPTEAARHQG
jgi:hypothetical protein